MNQESLEALAEILQILASPARLSLLASLQRPRTVADLSVPPSREDAGLTPGRAISRQSVERHLDILADAGLVTWRPTEGRGRTAKAYVLNHARLFAAVEELRTLTRLKAAVSVPEATLTLDDAPPPDPESIEGPRLVLVRGIPEGHLLPIPDTETTILGRDPTDAHLTLDHDPFVSGRHFTLHRTPDRVTIQDLETNRNGTHVNGRPLQPGERRPLQRGNLIAVGRSLLLYLE